MTMKNRGNGTLEPEEKVQWGWAYLS